MLSNNKKGTRGGISVINSKMQTQKVRKAIRKIKGKGGCNSINHLKVNCNLFTDKKEVAEVLAKNLSKKLLTDNYSDEFQRIKMLKEKRHLDFSSKNEEEYNLPFSAAELKQSLQRANDSATGLDQVHYQLLTHLPNSALSVLLKVYNHVWESGCFPPSWREAVVIPIPKPGKDHSDPGNFRPIALTSCLCKMMERMINARLMWSLESQGLLSEKQCGFRKNRSTLDHLVHFETFIRNAFIKKEHILTIFFDLEKAYDTTWKHGILADLWDLGFRGHLPRFIQSFLSECSFGVRVGSTLSELHEQEMGVPQGSILSPALFSIKINNTVKAILKLKGTDCSLFVDNFALCLSGKTLNRVERSIQLCVNSVQKWVSENGFKFSTSKTVCIHFHQQYVFFPDPNILLGKTPIKVVKEAKFLGLIFDTKLTFKNHIKYLKTSCQKALDILRVVGHTDWGADRIILLCLYRSLVRSKLDYGCIVYGSKNSLTVLKQRTELLRRLYQLNKLINLLPVGFQTTVQYIQQSWELFY